MAVSVLVVPTPVRAAVPGLTMIFVSTEGGRVTVKDALLLVMPPQVAVTSAVPLPTTDTIPFASTETIAVLLECQTRVAGK